MITRIQPPGIPRFGQNIAVSKTAAPAVAGFSASPLFGAQKPDEVTGVAGKRKLLLPPGTPMFFLHGLSSDGNYLKNLKEYVKSVDPNWPLYVSFIPEAHDGEPIENPKDPSDIPSARLALHDIGSFRYQYVRNNLTKLLAVAKETESQPEEVQKQKLAEYFDLLPEYADAIVPIIREFILFPAFQLPGDMRQRDFSRCLLYLVNDETRKLDAEVQKFKNPKNFPGKDIIDTNTLYYAAKDAGKAINLDPYMQFDGKKTINLRPIHFREIVELEGYLMIMEVGSSRVDLQACKLEYSIVSPK